MSELNHNEATVIICSGFENELDRLDATGYLLGRNYDDGDVWHITEPIEAREHEKALHSELQLVGTFTSKEAADSVDQSVLPEEYLDITIKNSTVKNTTLIKEDGEFEDLTIRRTQLDRLFVRLDQDNTPLNELQDKKVGIVGVGSGGSLLATYFAKSGVKNMVLVDGDRYEEHNIVRHILSLYDVGRKKTNAVKDYLQQRVPDLTIQTVDTPFELNTKKQADRFEELLGDCDIVVSATGAHNMNFRLESFIQSLDANIPVFYAGLFANLKGGILMRVNEKKDDPTYHEAYADLVEGETTGPTVEAVDIEGTYQAPEQEDAHSEPGLGIDVDNLTVFLAKMCLTELLDDVDHDRYKLDESIYIWANREFEQQSFDEDVWYRYPPLELSIIPESNVR